MAVPTITTKTWTGADGEYFTYEDMARVESNLNTMATFYGVPTQTFRTPTRASQFYYDDAQKIEETIKLISDMMGYGLLTVTWASGRGLSYIDFQRWESNLSYIQAHGDEITGKQAVHIMSSEALPSDLTWTLKDKDGITIATSAGSTGTGYFIVAEGNASVTISGFGTSKINSLTIQSFTEVDLMDYVCKLTVTSTVTFTAVKYNNSPIGVSGTSTLIYVPRDNLAYLVEIQPIAPPRYTGLSVANLYEYTSISDYVYPNGATATKAIQPSKVGNTILLTSSGTLNIPLGANYEIWTVGGGNRGGDGGTYYAGDGGNGGEIKKNSTSLSSGSYIVTIGAGGYKSNGTDYPSGDTSFKTSMLNTITYARGGYGAGGGGGWTTSPTADSRSGHPSQSPYCGGGGGGGGPSGSGAVNGGIGGTYGGSGGSGNKANVSTTGLVGTAGGNGTIIDGKGYGGQPYPTESGTYNSTTYCAGGGGGGYGANGGSASSYGSGGGGGGAYGGNGGGGRTSALGYGAGGNGGDGYTSTGRSSNGGGGGGGFGSFSLITLTYNNNGSAGAQGCIQIKWVS